MKYHVGANLVSLTLYFVSYDCMIKAVNMKPISFELIQAKIMTFMDRYGNNDWINACLGELLLKILVEGHDIDRFISKSMSILPGKPGFTYFVSNHFGSNM